jgi:hypothetical protein
MLFFLLRFRLPKPVFSRVKGKAQISICPSIGIAILDHSRTQNPFFMGFGKLKRFGFGLYWV